MLTCFPDHPSYCSPLTSSNMGSGVHQVGIIRIIACWTNPSEHRSDCDSRLCKASKRQALSNQIHQFLWFRNAEPVAITAIPMPEGELNLLHSDRRWTCLPQPMDDWDVLGFTIAAIDIHPKRCPESRWRSHLSYHPVWLAVFNPSKPEQLELLISAQHGKHTMFETCRKCALVE